MQIWNKKYTILIFTFVILTLVIAGCSTPEPTPPPIEGDPATVLGPPDGVDNFDNENNWTTFDSNCFKTEITGGQFVMTAKGIAQSACWEVSWPKLDNFYIEATQLMPQSCQPDDRFGLLFRAPDNNRGYLFGFTCAGEYSLNIWDGEKTTELVRTTPSNAIRTGSGVTNLMGVMAFGPNISLYANGVYLQTVADLTFVGEGKIGFFVRAATDNPFTVRYDAIRVWALDDEFYPPAVTPPYPPVDIPDPDPNVPSGTANVNVNVRTGPSMLFPILGTAQQGDRGEIQGTSPDGRWYAVKVPTSVVGTGTAWVAADYVTLSNLTGQPLPVITPPLLPPLVNFPPPPANAPQITMTEVATIRSGPTLEYPVYGTTPVGAKAEVLGESDDRQWWVIRMPTSLASDGTGWVYKAYGYTTNVTSVPIVQAPDLPPNVPSAAPGSGAPALVTREPINVRTGPGNEYPSIGKVPIGTILPVIGVSQNGEFYVINVPKELNQTEQGWLPARYVRTENVQNVPVIAAPPVP